jgi:phosphoglycolate phosphatase-like HAD superfamily hydrolase
MTTPYARAAWVRACRFVDTDEARAVRAAFERIEAAAARGARPVAVLDIDSSLYDTGPRTRRIIEEWLSASDAPRAVRKALEALTHDRHTFSLADLFEAAGLDARQPDVRHAIQSLTEFWRPRFFSNDYLPNDVAFTGAAAFVHRLRDLGSQIVYLTGRDRPGMHAGTLENFSRDGFPPPGPGVELWMKPSREGDDYEYKMRHIEPLRALGDVAVSLENEPRNFVGFFHAFPSAVHLFMDSVASPAPALPVEGGYRLRHFAPQAWLER